MLSFGADMYLANREASAAKGPEAHMCPWCYPGCAHRNAQRTARPIKPPKVSPQKSCLRHNNDLEVQEFPTGPFDEHLMMVRTITNRNTRRSVRFKTKTECQTGYRSIIFQDLSSNDDDSTKPSGARPSTNTKSARPESPRIATLSDYFSAARDPDAVDEMIVGAPGSHILLSRFAKSRNKLRARYDSADNKAVKPKQPEPRRRNLLRRITAF